MKKNVLIGSVVLLVVLAVAYGTKDMWWKKEAAMSGPTEDVPGSLTLGVGEEKRTEDLVITLLGVENDSRCAVDVQCITAGDASVRAMLRVGDASDDALLTLSGEPFWLNGYFVRVGAVYPEVRSNEVISPNTYRVTFTVEKGRKPGVYAPTFEEYPVAEVYSGDVPEPSFELFPDAEGYRNEVDMGLSWGPNLAGHYVFFLLPFRGNAFGAIAEMETGKIIAYGIPAMNASYTATSSLLIINAQSKFADTEIASIEDRSALHFAMGYVPAVSEYYTLENGALKFLGKFDIVTGEKRVCPSEPVLAYNPVTEEERNYPSLCDVPYGYELREQVAPEEVEKNGESWKRYESEEHAVSFEYRSLPNGYTLSEQKVDTNTEHNALASYVLMNTEEYTAFHESTESREAPPSITLSVFANPDAVTVEEWVKTNTSVSHFDATKAKLIPMKVGGVEGYLYNAEGLYPMSNVVVAREGKIYLLSGSYIARTDKIYRDFDAVLYSIAFAEPEASVEEEGGGGE